MASDTTRQIAFGYVVKWDPTGATTWETIGKVRGLTPPGDEMDFTDATTLEDTREQMLPGVKKATDFTFTALWRNADDLYEDMKAAMIAKDDANWQLVSPHGTPVTETFRGFIKSISRPAENGSDVLTCQVTVMTTSESVLT